MSDGDGAAALTVSGAKENFKQFVHIVTLQCFVIASSECLDIQVRFWLKLVVTATSVTGQN